MIAPAIPNWRGDQRSEVEFGQDVPKDHRAWVEAQGCAALTSRRALLRIRRE